MSDLKEAVEKLSLINKDISFQLKSFNNVLEKYINCLNQKSKNWS